MTDSQVSLFSSEYFKQRMVECYNKVESQIESSYNNISRSLDQILQDSVFSSISDQLIEKSNHSSFVLQPSTFQQEYIHPILITQIISAIQPSINSMLQREVINKQNLWIKEIKICQQKLDFEVGEREREYIEIIKKKDSEIQQLNEKQKQKKIQFTYELMNQNSISQIECCQAFAFNTTCSLVVAGSNNNINVFQFSKEKLNIIQVLKEHQGTVYTLNFMRNTNHFVSGSLDSLIIIWCGNSNNQWSCQQKLNGHSSYICCLILNNKDDLIVSGGHDKIIRFWMKQNQWFAYQTIPDHTNCIVQLSLNEQQQKLISCSMDSQIFVIEQSQIDKKWSIIQKIKVDQYGFRLCYIDDNQFTFQPYCKEKMHIYEMDNNTKQYRKLNKIAVKCGSNGEACLFPQQYLKSKGILINKNGNTINIIKKKKNGQFITQQCIEFGTDNIYGQLSVDGEYLIIWDNKQKYIQIRKYKEL